MALITMLELVGRSAVWPSVTGRRFKVVLPARFNMRLLLVGVAVCACFVPSGCSTTPAGLQRERSVYEGTTNAVSVVQRYFVPFVPAPWHEAATGAVGLASALLAAWNLNQQKRLKTLENGVRTAQRKSSSGDGSAASSQ